MNGTREGNVLFVVEIFAYPPRYYLRYFITSLLELEIEYNKNDTTNAHMYFLYLYVSIYIYIIFNNDDIAY